MSNLTKLAGIIGDYRHFPTPDVEAHISNWLSHFSDAVKSDILDEMVHLMGKTYISEEKWHNFIRDLVVGNSIAQGDKKDFWLKTRFIRNQRFGDSQREMMEAVEKVLAEEFDIELDYCGFEESERYVYIDDGIYSGKRVATDITNWLNEKQFTEGCEIELHIVSAVLYTSAYYLLTQKFLKDEEQSRKIKINVTFWRMYELENRLKYSNNSDVFWPKSVPDEYLAQEYYQELLKTGKPVHLRSGDNVGLNGLFTTPARRVLLEQEFLGESLKIRNLSRHFTPGFRPLGFNPFTGFGFGSTFVTFRNCPNNAPMTFWADTAFSTSLFKRKNNQK